MYDNTFLNKRFQRTPYFFHKHTSKDKHKVLDLGLGNHFSKVFEAMGRAIKITKNEDLDSEIRLFI